MQENYEPIQKGFRIFHPAIAGYIGKVTFDEKTRAWH